MFKNYINYILVICALFIGVSASTQTTDCTPVDPTIWGTGPWISGGSNYSFVAESGNDAILATGSADLSIEVFAGECGGESLGIYNTVGAGDIERIVLGDLTAGNAYSYTISGGGDDVQSKVKTYADSRLEDFDCNVNQDLIDQIYALREESMYINPAVQVTGFAFRFVNVSTTETIELVDATVDGFYQQLSTISGLET
jgi:hypothetical protein